MNDEAAGHGRGGYIRELARFTLFLGLTVFPIIQGFDHIKEGVRALVEGYIVKTADGGFRISDQLIWEIIGAAYVSAFLIFFLWRRTGRLKGLYQRYKLWLRREKQRFVDAILEKDELISCLKKRNDAHITSMKRIYSQLYNISPALRQNITRHNETFYVHANTDTDVEKTITIKALDEPVHFWSYFIEADEHSDPIDSLEDIHFSIAATDESTEIEISMLEDCPKLKKILVWFLPEISPNEGRTLNIHYSWPKFMANILELGQATYFWADRSRDTRVPGEFLLEFRFDWKLGDINCKNVGFRAPNLELSKSKNAIGTTWIFGGKKAPLGNIRYELLFSRAERNI